MEQKQISLNEIYKVLLDLKAKIQKMNNYIEDLEFARRTEESYQRHKAGDFIEIGEEEFLEELEKW